MAKIDEFKEFVKKNPRLLNYVKKGEKTWQNFYEIYDIYGEEQSAWKDYLTVETVATTAGLTEIFGWLKNINLDNVQNSVNSLQRVLGLVQDLSSKSPEQNKEEYKPRPIYKHFED